VSPQHPCSADARRRTLDGLVLAAAPSASVASSAVHVTCAATKTKYVLIDSCARPCRHRSPILLGKSHCTDTLNHDGEKGREGEEGGGEGGGGIAPEKSRRRSAPFPVQEAAQD
jgi:hypothetical protein